MSNFTTTYGDTQELLVAPTLPPNIRFSVWTDSQGDTVIELQKKKWLGCWVRIEYTFVPKYLVTAKRIQAAMKALLYEYEDGVRRDSFTGVYPPRKIIGVK